MSLEEFALKSGFDSAISDRLSQDYKISIALGSNLINGKVGQK